MAAPARKPIDDSLGFETMLEVRDSLKACIAAGHPCRIWFTRGGYRKADVMPAAISAEGSLLARGLAPGGAPQGPEKAWLVAQIISVSPAGRQAPAVSVARAEFETDGAPGLLGGSPVHQDPAGGTVTWSNGFTAIAGQFAPDGFSRAAESIAGVCLGSQPVTVTVRSQFASRDRAFRALIVPGAGARLSNGQPLPI